MSGKAGEVEDVLYREWMRVRELRDSARSRAKERAYYLLADEIQRMLESTSPYGHQLVWGVGRKPTR